MKKVTLASFLKNSINHIFSLLLDILKDTKEILSLLKELKELLSNIQHKPETNQVGNYISEVKAKKLLNRKTTWFYNQRKEGRLAYTKVGSQVFYKLKDIENLLEENNQQAIN